MASPRRDQTLSSVRNALRALDAYIDGEPLGISEVARNLGLPKSTTYRLISTLESQGFLSPGPRDKYTLGPRMYRLSRSLGLRKVAHQALTELHFATRDTVQLSVLEHHMVVYIDRIDSERMMHDPPLWRTPSHAAASGKVLLAHSDDSFVEEVIADGLARLTPQTIVDPLQLRAELSTVRERGYAIGRDEDCVGLASLAAPVHNARHSVTAAISVTCRTSRFDQSLVQKVVPLLLRAAEHVSAQLAARPG